MLKVWNYIKYGLAVVFCGLGFFGFYWMLWIVFSIFGGV